MLIRSKWSANKESSELVMVMPLALWWYPWLPDPLGVVIGVQQTLLTVSEGEPALVCVNLTLGTLARDVVVKLSTMNALL